MDFGETLKKLKDGAKLRRKGWNGKGIFIGMVPGQTHEDIKGDKAMTHDYLYIDTTGLQTDSEVAPKDLVPWAPSQTDLLANDWELVTDRLSVRSVTAEPVVDYGDAAYWGEGRLVGKTCTGISILVSGHLRVKDDTKFKKLIEETISDAASKGIVKVGWE